LFFLWEQILKNKQITRFHKKNPFFSEGVFNFILIWCYGKQPVGSSEVTTPNPPVTWNQAVPLE
jgi:hypothetical protein